MSALDGDRFVPTNPCPRGILKLLSDESNADIVFEVSGEQFHAHSLIFKACAPRLAEFCGDADEKKHVPVAGIDPEVFRHILLYVYGGDVPDDFFRERSRDIIDAADKLGIGSLKVEAEGWYVQSTPITLNNFVENLYFSDTKKCALLKEKVMDFLLENELEALRKLRTEEVPQSDSMLTDLLAASARKKCERKFDALETMSINMLRRYLDKNGSDIDGTREMLTAEFAFVAVVEGAGLPEINGHYTQVGLHCGAPLFEKSAIHDGKDTTFTMFLHSKRWWYISIVPEGCSPGRSTDIDYYKVGEVDCSTDVGWELKRNGWVVENNGIAPAPEVFLLQ